VKTSEDLPQIIHEAFHIATSGRPGPVLIDIPKDVQFAKGPTTARRRALRPRLPPRTKGDASRIAEAAADRRRAPADLLHRRRRHQRRPRASRTAARTSRP
jgi:acetolactate synthase-1/2/3 large subunit